MKANKLLKSKKAVSPVIATVILVSVTIVVAVAVAYWMGGIAGLYTAFEKIEIMAASTVKDDSPAQFNITISVKNTGSADATITTVYINGKTLTEYSATTNMTADGLTIPAGQGGVIEVYIPTSELSSGTTTEIKLHSAAGMDYPKLITLP